MASKNCVEIVVSAMNDRGEGVGRIDGKVHFIEGAVVGDRLRVEITTEKKSYNRARIVQLLAASPNRIVPPCRFSSRCGGCSVQQIAYAEQLRLKEQLVHDALQRIGAQSDYQSVPIIGMSNPYRYRNKALLPTAQIDGRLRVGLYQKGSHQLVPIDDCLIQSDICASIIAIVEDWAARHAITAYDEKRDCGQLRHIMIRSTHYGEHLIGLVTRTAELPGVEQLIAQLTARHKSIVSIVQNINSQRGNRILGNRYQTLYGRAVLLDKIGQIDYELSMASFFQVNPQQTVKLYDKAIELAALTGAEIAWDIYCGAGSISLQLAKHVKWVYGNEIVPQAIVNARANAQRNAIQNVTFIEGAAEVIVPTWLERYPRPDVVFLDPPRKGAEKPVLEAIMAIAPQKIIYVSCKPSTLARDVKYLTDHGYRLTTVVPVDMFAHTMHVETVALLSKLKSTEKIKVKIDLDEFDLTKTESKATYQQIKDYVLDNTGLKVSSLNIAQVKRKCGIIERKNYNKSKNDDARVPNCTEEKEQAIKKALKFFMMI